MSKIRQVFSDHWQNILAKLPNLIEGAVIMIIFLVLASVLKRVILKRLESKTEDKLRAVFITRVATTMIKLLGLMLAMKAAGYGDVAAGLVAGAGVSAFIIGFALKDIGENFLAGFLLSFSRPFRIDDTIEISGMIGKVRALNLRNTHVKTFDGKDIFIPNATLIKNPLLNYTLDGYMRREFEIGVDYDSDFSRARAIIKEVVEKTPGVASDFADFTVSHSSLGQSAYNIKVQYWQDMDNPTVSGLKLKTDLVEGCLKALNSAGIATPGDIIELRPLPTLVSESK